MNKTTLVLLGAAALSGAPAGRAETSGAPQALSLRQAVARGLARAPSLAADRARLEQGSAAARLAADEFHPQLFATTTPGYASGLPVAVAGSVPAIGGVDLRQTLYDPARRGDELQARADEAEAGGALENARLATIRSVVLAYERVRLSEGRVEAARTRLVSRRGMARRAEELRDEGRLADLDLERARLEAERSEQALQDARDAREIDRQALANLVGWTDGAPWILPDDPLEIVAESASEASDASVLAADPQLRALGLQLDLLGRSARIFSRRFAPVIEAQMQYLRLTTANDWDKYYLNFKADDWSVGVAVAIPIWSGGRRADQAGRAGARVAQLEAQRRARTAEIELALRRAESDLRHASDGRSLAAHALDIARRQKDQALALAREGRGAADGVEAADVALADARAGLADAELRLLEARLQLAALRGSLTASLAPPADSSTSGGGVRSQTLLESRWDRPGEAAAR
jgi:outer membrane protein